MSLITDSVSSPSEIKNIKSNSLFIWLDILGFAEAVDKEDRYRELSELLTKFQNLFNNSHKYDTKIISDGIVLYIKNPNYNDTKIIFNEIAKKQFEFILENKYFIRGGIALGSRHSGDAENDLFISNGLARAVKIESSIIDWPVIGIDEKYILELRSTLKVTDHNEYFGLKRGYNKNGQTIYFIDFAQDRVEYLEIIYTKIEKFNDKSKQSIRNKYIWLLRYYLSKFESTEINISFEGIVL
jgi:hypothetical protein